MDQEVIEMVDSRDKNSVIYIKFMQDYDEYPDKIFCFFEGEDYKYYRNRIIETLNVSDDNIFHYDCKGKNEVLKLYEYLKYDKNSKKMFFIDRDFDKKIQKNGILFQTDGYSVENYYVSDTAFKKFISTEMDLNTNNINFKKCVEDYVSRKEEFNNAITRLNAYIKYIRLRDKDNLRLEIKQDKELINFFVSKIEVDNIKCFKERNFNEIKQYLKDENTIDETQIEKIELKLKEIKNKDYEFRGKFELYFLKKFYQNLKEKINNENYFENYDKKIKLDINIDTLTLLNTYADTSVSLKEFLINFKKRNKIN